MLPDHHDLYTFNTFLINYLYRYPHIDSRLGCTSDYVISGIEKDLPLKKTAEAVSNLKKATELYQEFFNKK